MGRERRPGRAPRWKRLLTAAISLTIIVGEFFLLGTVYHYADPVRSQLVTAASVAGQLQATVSADAAGMATPSVNSVRAAIDQLEAGGVSEHDLAGVQASAHAFTVAPGLPALNGVLIATRQLQATLHRRVNGEARDAAEIYVGGLAVLSVGWFLWFRRLVARHRALQREVTEQQAAVAAERRLAALVHNSSDVVAVLDIDSTVRYVTPSSLAVLGRDEAEMIGLRILDLAHPADEPALAQALAGSRPGDETSLQVRIRHADGRDIHADALLNNLLGEPAIGGLVITLRDTTERAMFEEQLTHQAFHDSLTGLANRQLFTDRLAHALQARRGGSSPLAVIFFDLDDFKNVNDSMGHSTGDLLLNEVGRRVLGEIRPNDTAARLGGDEFAILLEETDLGTAQASAVRILAAIEQPYAVDGPAITLRASVGVAPGVPGEMAAEETLRNADVAMYLAKNRGKSQVAVYESRLHEEALDRLALRGELQRAVRNGRELFLEFQPTVDLDDGHITGFEALVRWAHPFRGVLAPDLFIPMAEESGLILPLGEWVLNEACRAALAFGAASPTTMAVNISARQLADDGFVDVVLAALRDSGLAPERLVLEITETAVMADLPNVAPRLQELRELGVRVAIDDFGTGYSSLAYLTNLPVDILKVDKSFIDDVASSSHAASVADAIISMSRSLNLATVAEGVEQASQAQWLRGAHCTLGQGYLWSRPVPLPEALHMVTRPVVQQR